MPKQPITIQDLAKIKIVSDPQISPDGKRVLYVVKVTHAEKNKYWSHLWLAQVNDGQARQFTFGEVSDSAPRWSRDGRTIALLRTKDKRSQIWLVPTDGGEARALTDLSEGAISDLSWSPEDDSLAFCFRRTHPDWTQDATKKRGDNGKSSPARVVKHALYRLDGFGFQDERQHVWVCDVTTGNATQITRGDYDDASPAWSPDGKTLAFVSNRSGDRERLRYRDDLWLVPARGGNAQKLATPVGSKTAPAWSPDGKWIAYIGVQVGKDPWRPQNDRLWVVSKRGGEARCLSMELDRVAGNVTLGDTREPAPTVPIWSPDGKRIYVPFSDSGSCHLYAIDVASCQMTLLTTGALDVSGVSMDAAGKRFALLVANTTQPAEVYLGKPQGRKLALTQLSDANGEWLKSVQISQPEEFWITQPDGTRVQGWIMRPPTFKRTNKYPLLVYVHGGPHAQYGNVFFHEMQLHAARGYVVVYSNPRGSNGREEEFGACIHRDWGNVDYQDVMAIADYGEELPYVDKTRTAIAGGSYGGYMTNWVVGHTDRFKCAVTDRCVSNFISMVGTSDMPPPPNSYWPGVPWGDDMEQGWNMSPIKYVDKVRTPMLIIHSEGDLRCPISQAEEWYTALKWLKQKVVLVRYPRETSHGLSRGGPIDLRMDRLQRISAWLDQHLQKR
ncbi:MAG: S9 family peptidase [Chloroflexi bacterium]|nr:S9 family peptidase [Chloroflexota bacterium]